MVSVSFGIVLKVAVIFGISIGFGPNQKRSFGRCLKTGRLKNKLSLLLLLHLKKQKKFNPTFLSFHRLEKRRIPIYIVFYSQLELYPKSSFIIFVNPRVFWTHFSTCDIQLEIHNCAKVFMKLHLKFKLP